MTRAPRIAAAVLIVLGAARIATTYRVFSDTSDEANHVGAGLDLIARRHYDVQLENPPLPRLVLAAVPWLCGMRYNSNVGYSDRLRSVFFGHGEYKHNLVCARVGNLLFFVMAAVSVWLLARGALDATGSLLALLLFTTQPVVLGYSGLATHDIAATAGTAVGLVAFARWLRAPSVARACAVGVAYGFSALCKFSCIAFVPAGCLALFAVQLIHDPELRRRAPRALATLLVVPLVAFITLWAGYAFSVGKVGDHTVPAAHFFNGMKYLLDLDRQGFLTFAWGHVTEHGWWWYFPFAFGLKTTLSLLIVLLLGAWFAMRAPELRWTWIAWTLAAAAIMAPATHSSLDLGVRYVLPVYVPFSIAAAAAAMAMLRARGRVTRAAAAVLLVWHLAASALAHPDYFPYFNELAARHPSRYLIDSNIDWGQDLLRLRSFCRRNHITELPRAVFGSSDLDTMGLPPVIEIDWNRPPKVPTALSETVIVASRMHSAFAFPWADEEPYVRVGKSIRMYGVVGR